MLSQAENVVQPDFSQAAACVQANSAQVEPGVMAGGRWRMADDGMCVPLCCICSTFRGKGGNTVQPAVAHVGRTRINSWKSACEEATHRRRPHGSTFRRFVGRMLMLSSQPDIKKSSMTSTPTESPSWNLTESATCLHQQPPATRSKLPLTAHK